jgi:hypothetical protein
MDMIQPEFTNQAFFLVYRFSSVLSQQSRVKLPRSIGKILSGAVHKKRRGMSRAPDCQKKHN